MFKRIIFFSLFLSLLVGGYCLYDSLSEGFSIRQIRSSLPYISKGAISPPSEEKLGEVRKILDQPFHYLGKGTQAYVFESLDGEFVLKFFKHKHLRQYERLAELPMPAFLKRTLKEKADRRRLRVEELFASCKFAYEELPEETGLVFIHLNKLPQTNVVVELRDKLGITHLVKLDDYEFMIQKRATLVHVALAKCIEEENMRQARVYIGQILDSIVERCQGGIRDRDRALSQNIAFSKDESRVLFIDFGQFEKDATLMEPTNLRKELVRRGASLKAYMDEKFPLLTPIVQEELESRLELFFSSETRGELA